MTAHRLRARLEPAAGFGAKLRELRDRRGYSQQQLAAGLGIRHPLVSNWERGRQKPERETVERLERALQAAGELASAYVEQEAAELQTWLEGLL